MNAGLKSSGCSFAQWRARPIRSTGKGVDGIEPAEGLDLGGMKAIDRNKVRTEFDRAVNMTAAELEKWLRTDESRKVGFKGKDGAATESVGHISGRRLVRILRKSDEDLTADDYAHMRKVTGYVRRHRAQRPANIYTSRWRYSLMNWGHDPIKE